MAVVLFRNSAAADYCALGNQPVPELPT